MSLPFLSYSLTHLLTLRGWSYEWGLQSVRSARSSSMIEHLHIPIFVSTLKRSKVPPRLVIHVLRRTLAFFQNQRAGTIAAVLAFFIFLSRSSLLCFVAELKSSCTSFLNTVVVVPIAIFVVRFCHYAAFNGDSTENLSGRAMSRDLLLTAVSFCLRFHVSRSSQFLDRFCVRIRAFFFLLLLVVSGVIVALSFGVWSLECQVYDLTVLQRLQRVDWYCRYVLSQGIWSSII